MDHKLTEKITVALDEALLARLEREAQRRETAARVRVSRSQVARDLIDSALATIEAAGRSPA